MVLKTGYKHGHGPKVEHRLVRERWDLSREARHLMMVTGHKHHLIPSRLLFGTVSADTAC